MRSISVVLKSLSTSIVSKAKTAAPFKTGRLRKSIKGVVKGNKISISMLNYGRTLDNIGRHKDWFSSIVRKNVAKAKQEIINAFKATIIKDVKGTKTKRLSGVR